MVRTLSSERREALLQSALSLFAANGVQNTSTAEIAKAAETAAGTLFLYFPTKQDLMHELVLKIGREQSEYIQSLLYPSFSAREAFWTIWQGSITWFLEHIEAYQFNQQVRDSEWIADSVVQETLQFFGYYFDAIQKGMVEGSIQPYPFEMIGSFLYQDIVASLNLLKLQADAEKREEEIRMGFEIFWNGIRAQKAE